MPLPDRLQPILERELDEGEVVRWADTPRYHALRRKLIKNAVLINVMLLVFLAMWFFLGFFASIDPERSRADVYIPIALGIVFLLIGVVGNILAFRDTRYAADNTIYAVTDRRVIILRLKRNGSITEDDYRRDQIAHIAREEHPDGTGSLTLDVTGASISARRQITAIADPLAVERLIRAAD